jgi:hypothetical protein
MTTKRILWLIALMALVAGLAVIVLVLAGAPQVPGGYAFTLIPGENAPRVDVEYLAYGTNHLLLTCGPRPAHRWEMPLQRSLRWLGLRGYGPPVAYLAAHHNARERTLVVYASIQDPSLRSMEDDVVAYYVGADDQRLPMRFAIGKSSSDGAKHLIAWKVSLAEPPGQSSRIEIVQPRSNTRYATVANIRATDMRRN